MSRNSTTIVAIVKNEARYLIEWIAHHRRLGVAHFIIFDNESTDGTNLILRKLAEKDIVETYPLKDHECGEVAPQLVAYRRGAELAATEWILFCDADEFVYFEDEMTFDDFTGRFPADVAVVMFNWRAFGSSNVKRYQDLPVTERFRLAAHSQNEANRWVKSLARRERIRDIGVHLTRVFGARVHVDGSPFEPFVDSDGKRAKSASARIVHEPAALAHFGVKSREEFNAKIARGRAGVSVSSSRKMTPRSDAVRKWRTYDHNEVEPGYFTGTAADLRKEMTALENIVHAKPPLSS